MASYKKSSELLQTPTWRKNAPHWHYSHYRKEKKRKNRVKASENDHFKKQTPLLSAQINDLWLSVWLGASWQCQSRWVSDAASPARSSQAAAAAAFRVPGRGQQTPQFEDPAEKPSRAKTEYPRVLTHSYGKCVCSEIMTLSHEISHSFFSPFGTNATESQWTQQNKPINARKPLIPT